MFDTKAADTSLSMTHYIDICKAVKPAVSPDGELLVYLSDESGTAQVWGALLQAVRRASLPICRNRSAILPSIPRAATCSLRPTGAATNAISSG